MTDSNSNNNDSRTPISNAVLTWLQKELSLYSELLLISPIRESFSIKPLLVCLAHHFFPESIPNLIDQLQQQPQPISAIYQLFQQNLSIPIPLSGVGGGVGVGGVADNNEEEEEGEDEKWAQDYLFNIYSAITEKRQLGQDSMTLRELHIGSTDKVNNNPLSATPSTQEFERYIISLLLPLNKLFHQLVELSIREEQSSSNTTRSPSPRIINNNEPFTPSPVTLASSTTTTTTTELSPIKSRLYSNTCTSLDDTASLASSSSSLSLMTLEEIENSLNSLESREMMEYKTFLHQLDNKIKQHPDIAIKISAIDATHAALHLQLHKGDMLRTTIQFTNTAAYIRNELEFIQAKMLKTTTTDLGIQDLEQRAKLAGSSIDNMSIRFKNLLETDTSQREEYTFLQDKYRLICNWVDEVRVWFVEAERIRKWLEERIQLLESNPMSNNNSMNSALEEVELDYETIPVQQLNHEQVNLEKEVEAFDKEDMTRLRAHVKALTTSSSHKKDLSPADTTTIEITFTTLMTLDRLMHLLRRQNYELQMLTLRMYWEQEYHVAVTWVRATGESVKLFVQHKARWRPPLDDYQQGQQQQREEIIQQLIDFEKQSTTFDQGQFTTTVNMYQDLDDACNIELPSHLESRQVALEEAFEELTNRIAFARQVVEQFLVVMDFLDRADKLKMEGEELRQEITLAAEQHNSNLVGASSTNGSNDFSEKVTLFQENAVRLVTGAAARIPYPEASHPTDQQGNDDANEVIRMIIGARKSALVLFGETLDQSLATYRRALQLQKRGKQLMDEIGRLVSWVDERLRSIKKSKVEDVFAVGKCALGETDLLRLKKERDGQVAKLNGIKENDFNKLQDNIQALQDTCLTQTPTNQNTMALLNSLNQGIKNLQDQLKALQDALGTHSLCLDILGIRISWESQHYKTSQWISNMTFTVWEFVAKKAQWRASDVVTTSSELSSANSEVVQQEFDLLQHKVQGFHIEQLESVDQIFSDLVNGFKLISENNSNLYDDLFQQHDRDITLEHVQRRQNVLTASYHNLYDLLDFTNQVLLQHTALSNFSTQVSHLSDKGHGLLSDIQAAMKDIMKLTGLDDRRQGFVTAVKEFSQDVVTLWMNHGSQLPYPQCPEDARATRPSTSDDEISTEVATVIYKTYTELQDLAKRLADLLQRLDISISYRNQLEQWCTEVDGFTKEMVDLTKEMETVYIIDLATGSVVSSSSSDAVSVNTYSEKADFFSSQVVQLKTARYDLLVNQLQDLKNTMDQDDQEACASLDTSVTQPSLKAMDASWQSLSQSVQVFSRQVIFCNHRITWESIWNNDWQQINQIQEGVREWINEKNMWLSSSQQAENSLDALVARMKTFDGSMQSRDLAPAKSAFQDVVTSYKALSQLTPVVDHVEPLEDKQDDLIKLTIKLQDTVSTQLSEIELLKSRFDWESSVDLQLKQCAENTLETESFIRDYARWCPSTTNVDPHPIHISAESQVASLSSLLKSLDQLQPRSSSLLQTELIFKKKSSLESNIDRIQSHVAFVDQVVKQREIIDSSLAKVSDLETLAESIKTKLLSSDLDGGEQTQLDDYNTKVSELVQTMSQVMVYPVRHYRDHDATCRNQDESHNAAMSEMVAARKSRLEELGNSLESILKSKERLSRCKAAEETYMAEAQVVQDWIGIKFDQVKTLETPVSRVLMEDLRAAVNGIGAIQSAAMTYTSSVQGLKESANQCIAIIQQQGQEDQDALGRIQSTQSSITLSWDDLLSKIHTVKTYLSTDLRHAEYIQCVESFHTQCSTLQADVVKINLDAITEEVTGQWQKDIQMLESSYIEQIRSRLSEEKVKVADTEGVSPETLAHMGDMLTTALKDFDTFKKMIGDRTTEANHHRLKNEYFEKADVLDTCIKETRDALQASKSDTRVIHGHSEQQDKVTVKQAIETYQAICDLLENQHQEKYDEQRSFYRFLQLNKATDLSAVDTRQSELEKAWKQLKMDLINDKQHVDAVSQWYDLHNKLNEMQSEALSGIYQRLDRMILVENDATMPTFLEQDAALLKLLESRLDACWDIATSLIDDGGCSNMSYYQLRHEDLQRDVKKAQALLDKKKATAQKHVDFVSCQHTVREVSYSVNQVVDTVKKRLDSLDIEGATSSKQLEQLYRASSTALGTTESVKIKVDAQATTVIEPLVSSLEVKYADDNRIDTFRSDLVTSLEMLNKTLGQEQAVNDMMRRVLGHAKSAENISTWIDNCNTATSQVLGDHVDEGEASFDLASLSHKLVDFENVIQSFKELSASILSTEVVPSTDEDALSKLIDITTQNSTLIEAKWKETQEQLKSVQAVVEKTARGIAIARKIKNIMALVGETREFASSVKLFDLGNQDDDYSVHTQDDKLDDDEAVSSGLYDNEVKMVDVVVARGHDKMDDMTEEATSPTAATIDSDDVDDDKTKIGGSREEMKSDQQVIDKQEDNDSTAELIGTQPHRHEQQQQQLLSMLRQSEVESIQQNLQSLEGETKPQIESEVQELNTMISACDDIDGTFIRQHQEVQESVASLFSLVAIKYTELDRALDIGKYLTIADDIEILQTSLEEALSQSVPPHHAIIMGTGFSRTDLQAKLIELDARFKYYERKIVQNMTSAKQQAEVVIVKQEVPESDLVQLHLQEMQQKWDLIKKQFKTRKIELSRTIDTSLDPNKEQHARIRKSSLPTRKASSLLRDHRASADLSLSRLSPTISSTSSSTSSTATATTRSSSSRLNPSSAIGVGKSSTNNRYLTPPQLQHQPSKSATHIKPKTNGRLLTPAIIKPPLNSYVADPDNDLDIEIGRIVNETPYRVKVKMVPGEVGRYWFGNLNPKLAYCRVLKSKMVMVRVGGGWTELSQFLRDHALLEGDFIPRSRRNTANAKMMIPEEEEPKSPTIQEGFIETRRDLNRPAPRRRSVSPNTQPQQHRSSTTTSSSGGSRSNTTTTTAYPTGSPSHSASTSGYKEGDMFIAVDQHGNQLEVQMRKAEPTNVGRNMSTGTATTSSNDYTRRRIARRKDKSAIPSTNNTSSTITTSHIPTKAASSNTLQQQQQ